MSGSWYLLREWFLSGTSEQQPLLLQTMKALSFMTGDYPGRSVPGWIGACVPWYIYCPVMSPIMCKYHLSQEQPYVQELSCGQPEQVCNVNNEFNRVTAVSVDTRGIWLCSVRQQEEGIRKDTFCVQDEVRESPKNSWTPSCLQQALHSSHHCFVPLQETPKPAGCSSPVLGRGQEHSAPPALRRSAAMALPYLCCQLPL